jgi:hydroxyacylglutathione hydrolase
MSLPAVKYHTIISMLFDENTYVVHREGASECLVVDPGLEPKKIHALLEQQSLVPVAILCTHGHSDHIAGNDYMKEHWPEIPLIIGEGDAYKLTDPVANLSANFGVELVSPPADSTVREGDCLELAGMKLDVLETPGHSVGHVVFVLSEEEPQLVLGGDVLFAGSVGRTDFPDGSMEDLKHAIHHKLFPLPDDTIVLPGHGPTTTIGKEKRTNPFVGLG